MTMDSTALRSDAAAGHTGYPLDPLSGVEIESAAAIVAASEYATDTLRFVMIQLAEPEKNAALTFEDWPTFPDGRF